MKKISTNCLFLGTVYYYGKIIGVYPYTYDKQWNWRLSRFGTMHNVFLIAFYTYCYITIICYRLKLQYPQETHLGIMIDTFAISIKYISVTVFWFILGFRQQKLKYIFDSFQRNEENLINFDLASTDKKKTLSKIFQQFKFYILYIYFLVTLLSENLSQKIYFGPAAEDAIWSPSRVFQTINYIFILTFIEIMLYLRTKYRELNKILNKTFSKKTLNKDINVFDYACESIFF